MKVVVASGGRFHSLHLAHQLEKHQVLYRLLSGSYTKADRSMIDAKLVKNFARWGLMDRLFTQFRLAQLINPARWNVFKDDLFDRWLMRQLEFLEPCDLFVGWAHYFLNSVPQLRRLGAKIVVECGSLHIAEHSRLLEEEYRLFGIPFVPVYEANKEKLMNEYAAADAIMVPSSQCVDSFVANGISHEKLYKVPYGVDVKKFHYSPHAKTDRVFRVLFAGQVSLNKGVQYLLKSWEAINLPQNKSELVIVGNITPDFKRALEKIPVPKNVKFLGGVSHDKLARLYQYASVFVMPSLAEGIAMVQAEAMASGLPVIATTHSGGCELLHEGKHGFIVPIRDSQKLAEKLIWGFDNQDRLKAMGAAAAHHIQTKTWDAYGEQVITAYNQILGNQPGVNSQRQQGQLHG